MTLHRLPQHVLPAAIACGAMALAGCGAAPGRGAAADTEAAEAENAPEVESPLELTIHWTWDATSPSVGMPGGEGGEVAVTVDGRRLVLVGRHGQVRWEARRAGLRDVAPAFSPELVLAAADDGLVAYDRAGGRRRWEAVLGERANAPTVAGSTAYFTTGEGSLMAVGLADGKLRWRTKLGGPALGPVALSGDVVVATFDSGAGAPAGAVAVEAATGRPRWKAPLQGGGVSAPAVVATGGGDAVVVAVASDIAAHGLSLRDGTERWRQGLPGSGSPEVPPLALPGAKVLVGHRLGGMVMLDATDGHPEWGAQSESAAVRGGPIGPGPNGWFAMPLWDGTFLLAQPPYQDIRQPPGQVSGLARGAGDALLVGIGQGGTNGVDALTGW